MRVQCITRRAGVVGDSQAHPCPARIPEVIMSAPAIEALDLAALLCSRVCHDLISPIGAIVNGLEVLAEEKDAETQQFAMELIKKSSRTASAKLQFCRIAFGAAGSAGAQIDLGDAETIARGFLEDDKTKLTWNLPRALLAKNRVKLLLNLLLIAGQAIPRGGVMAIDPVGSGETMGFTIRATGTNARIPPHAAGLLAGERGEGLDAHRIQPFYAGLLAQASGVSATIAMDGDAVVLSAS
jgi:histidine phosphotransferase ChpT